MKKCVALAMALQRCTTCSKMPPGMLCIAVQELCRCLDPLLDRGDLDMLDMVRKDPLTPAPVEKGPITETQSGRIDQGACP